MAKKLVIDRPIELKISSQKAVTVPRDEVWRVSISSSSDDGEMASFFTSQIQFGSYILAGGCSISGGGYITGIAFKVVEV